MHLFRPKNLFEIFEIPIVIRSFYILQINRNDEFEQKSFLGYYISYFTQQLNFIILLRVGCNATSVTPI